MPSTSILRSILTASLIFNKKGFFTKSINRVKDLMLKEDRIQTLIKVGTEEAAAPISQDEESYDRNISKVDEEDAEVVPEKIDDAYVMY